VDWARASTSTAAAALAGLAGLHSVWGFGSTWPLPDRASFVRNVIGGHEMPPPAACFAVAGALALGASFVAGRPQQPSWLRRLGATGVVGVLSARGTLGLLGRTDVVSPGATSPSFRHLDRRYYSPLCLVIAALSAPAIRRPG